jgi:hypothetical protein
VIAILGVLGLFAAVVGAFVGWASRDWTECVGYFPSQTRATRTLDLAHAIGLSDTDLNRRHSNGGEAITFTSHEGGDDADFRRTVRALVAQGGGHMAGCQVRPTFD